jgi:hypothetical protein
MACILNVIILQIQGVGQGKLTVCFSRNNEMPKSEGDPGQGGTSTGGVTCRVIANSESTEFNTEWPCDKIRNAIDCKPHYFSVVATESLNRCSALTTGSSTYLATYIKILSNTDNIYYF